MPASIRRIFIIISSVSNLLVAGGVEPEFSWQQTETSLALCNREKIVWKLVFDAKQPKTYFHPLATLEGQVLTEFEPEDHPWHRGLWWSWKFINGLNYWEEDRQTHASEGVNELTHAKVMRGVDFAAQAELHFSYHPPGKPPVMTEIRKLSINRPDSDGRYWIDWTSTFTVGDAPVKLDRTPTLREGGVDFGGYAGLSLRFPVGLTGWSYRTSEAAKSATNGHGKSARWVDFSGKNAGISVFDHPDNMRHPTPWYLSEKPELIYLSPAVLLNESLTLAAQQSIKLTYRIMIHSKPITDKTIDMQWNEFSSPVKP